MEDQNKLILIESNNLVQKVNTSIFITNKLIVENNKQLVMKIFEKNPKMFIKLISIYYKPSEKFLEKYKENIGWDHISFYTSFSIDFFIKNQEKFNWFKFSDGLRKKLLSVENNRNHNVWNESTLEMFKDKLSWETLSYKEGLPWSLELLEKYIDRWDWERLSRNEGLPWSKDFFDKYIDRWNWKILSINRSLPWSKDFFDKYNDRWDWERLSYNEKLPWSSELLEKYINRWNWGILSDNQGLPWSLELVEKYIDKWDWERLSRNKFVQWSVEFIHKFSERFTGSKKIYETLELYIDEDMIEIFFDRINKKKYV